MLDCWYQYTVYARVLVMIYLDFSLKLVLCEQMIFGSFDERLENFF